jgi:multiple sugar transport system substrate-binding protein/sn-glycerol 3-phosphate transport system substrate-binding protein
MEENVTMTKRKFTYWFVLLLLVLPFVLSACGSPEEVEQQVEEAVEEVEQAATQAAPTLEAAATEVMEEVEEAATEVAEAVEPTEEPMEPTEEPMEATEEPMEPEYDTEIYGNIDELVNELDGATVVFWHQHSGGREEELLKIVDDFNATNEYGIVIDARNEGGYDDIYNKMIAGLTSGEVPGLTVAYQNQAAAYQAAEGLVSLEPYINHPVVGLTEEDQADFFASFIESDRLPQFGGEAFGFPPNRSMEVMYYNQEWLTEMGFDGPPATPEEFTEMACMAVEQPFSKNQDTSLSVGYEISTDASRFASFVFAHGGDIYDYENNRFTLNTPEAVAAMTWMKDMYDRGCAILIAENFGDQTDFGNGKNLFTVGSSSGLPFYVTAVTDGEAGGFEWSVAAIPHTTADPVQNIYGASVSVPRTDPATQLAAWLFIKYYTSPEIQARWAVASNYFPVRESVAEGLGDYFATFPAYETAFNLLEFGHTEPPVAGYDNVRDVIDQSYNRILAGEDPATVLAEAEEEANALLEEAMP